LKQEKQYKLIKMFRAHEDKVVYIGNLKRCKKKIPPSKKNQYKIVAY